ncbi:unnamed protein product, partial [Prorocentrum cordatum]
RWTMAVPGDVDEGEHSSMVKAMLPLMKRALTSTNPSVVQASLDSLKRMELMFDRGAMDPHVEALAEVLERQCVLPGGAARAGSGSRKCRRTGLLLEAAWVPGRRAAGGRRGTSRRHRPPHLPSPSSSSSSPLLYIIVLRLHASCASRLGSPRRHVATPFASLQLVRCLAARVRFDCWERRSRWHPWFWTIIRFALRIP